MKKFSKILSIALLVALVLSLGIANAFAADSASITITHDATYEGASGTTPRVYVAYKIFDASYETLAGENTQDGKDDFTYDPSNAAVAYSLAADSPWLSLFIDDEGDPVAAQTWFTVTQAGDGSYVVVPAGTDGAAIDTAEEALAFAEYLQDNMPDGVTGTEVTVDGGAVAVDPGYYLIVAKDAKDSATKIALVTTDVTMVEKNTYITTGKTAAQAAYQIGDIVTFTATVDIPADTALTIAEGDGYKVGHGPIVLHDVMVPELTFAGQIKTASIGADAYTLVWTENTSAVNHTTDQADGCTFEIVIPVTTDLLGTTVTFTYEAEVNSSAVGEDGLINTLGGDINGYKTNPDSPVVYTFDFSFKKEFDDSTDTDLTATFVLQDVDGNVIPLTKIDDTHYAIKDSDDTAVTDNLITITNGQEVNIKGVKDATYNLVEMSTSAGYNLLDAPVEIVVTDTTKWGNGVIVGDPSRTITVDGEELDDGVYTFDVVNNAGTVLPSTGGIGTTLFYVIGSILVLGAGVVLVAKKRAID
nr:isopeptide-forming domain-containing fimbrial protein [Clostridia bacterium]